MIKKFLILVVLIFFGLIFNQPVLGAVTVPTDQTATTPKVNTPEEQAVYNIDNGQFPESIDQGALPPQTQQNIFSGIGNLIGGFFSSIGALFSPNHPDQLVVQSSKSSQVIVPDQIKQQVDQKPADERTKSYFGNSTGVYGAQMPDIQNQQNNVGAYEQTYEQANFPDGIHPITGQ